LNKLLAVSTGGLGDTILFSPLLKALRKSYPRAHIELLVANKLAQEAYSCAKEVSSVTMVNLQSSFSILRAISLIPFMLETHKNGRFDTGFFATGLNPILGRLLKAAGIVSDIIHAPAVPSCSTDFDCNLELARRVEDSIGEKDIFIPESEEAKLETNKLLKEHGLSLKDMNIIAIYPSIELEHRPRWELSKLMEVIKMIKRNGFSGKTVVVGSSLEGQEWDAIDNENIVDANLAGKLSILGSAVLLSHCSLTIGNDGGLMHVAGAVQCPLVVIMANTPLSYRPAGNNVKIVHSKFVCCDGLYPNKPKDCPRAKCIEDIKVKKVFEACKTVLSRNDLNLFSNNG
jgi:heptosyltransferase-2